MKHVFIFLALLTSSFLTAQNAEDTPKDSVQQEDIIIKPQFEGGTPGMIKYLQDNLQFSEKDMGGLKKAKIYVKFIINTKGEVTKVENMNSVNEVLDKEALRIIESMPYWRPGIKNGTRVNTEMVLPISFMVN